MLLKEVIKIIIVGVFCTSNTLLAEDNIKIIDAAQEITNNLSNCIANASDFLRKDLIITNDVCLRYNVVTEYNPDPTVAENLLNNLISNSNSVTSKVYNLEYENIQRIREGYTNIKELDIIASSNSLIINDVGKSAWNNACNVSTYYNVNGDAILYNNENRAVMLGSNPKIRYPSLVSFFPQLIRPMQMDFKNPLLKTATNNSIFTYSLPNSPFIYVYNFDNGKTEITAITLNAMGKVERKSSINVITNNMAFEHFWPSKINTCVYNTYNGNVLYKETWELQRCYITNNINFIPSISSNGIIQDLSKSKIPVDELNLMLH